MNNNLLSTFWRSCTGAGNSDFTTLHELNDAENYTKVVEEEAKGGGVDVVAASVFTDDMFVAFVESDTTTTEIVTYVKSNDGVWREEFRQVAPERFFQREFVLSQNEIIIAVGDSIQIYNYTPISGWQFDRVLHNTKYSTPAFGLWGDRITIVDSTLLLGIHGFPFFASRDLPSSTVPEIIVYERNSSNEWQLVYDQSFPGGGNLPISKVVARENNSFITLSNTGFLNVIFSSESEGAGSTVQVTPMDSSNDCDYSQADQFDGWGWNPVLFQSCAPLATNTSHTSDPVGVTEGSCDYSNAILSGGWGWNESTRESCAPLGESTEAVEQVTAEIPAGCDYSDASQFNGWGWNESIGESCAPLSESTEQVDQVAAEVPAGCDYSSADMFNGWGWNEATRQSCAPL